MKKTKRGGRRENSGRKKLGKEKLLISVSPDCAKKIRNEAGKEKTIGEVVEERFP